MKLKSLLILSLFGCWLGSSATAATFTVTNANATGAGSLREAITSANALAGLDVIEFNIPGAGVHTININTSGAFPDINSPVFINGFTQPLSNGNAPLIELNGTGLQGSLIFVDGSDGSTVAGLVVNRGQRGIWINNADNITIRGCFLGMGPDGNTVQPTAWNGIQADFSFGHVFGGTGGINDRNLISGNGEVGIRLESCQNVTILGNIIGLNLAGNADRGNGWHGIVAFNGSHGLTVGGNSAAAMNVISGNNFAGLRVENSNNIRVWGNRVGTSVLGTAVVGNTQHGISFLNVTSLAIGGLSAAEGNLISGNGESGVFMENADDVTLYNNYIGTNVLGTLDFGNTQHGIHAVVGSNNILIGADAAGNVIAGNNQNGIFLNTSVGVGIQGNRIGTNAAGTAALANGFSGIFLLNGNTAAVGGATAGLSNVISSNSQAGLRLENFDGVVALGNFIGTDITGTLDLGNGWHGVFAVAGCDALTVGSAAAPNVISGNGQFGINIENCAGALMRGNRVGTNLAGTAAINNGFSGIRIDGAASTFCVIGGSGAGQGNIISGNSQNGVLLQGTAADISLLGNFIGTNATGTAILPNAQHGVNVDNSPRVVIGGTAAGAGNVIGGSNLNGINIVASTTPTIRGNFIGVGTNGTTDVGNTGMGILLDGGSVNATIGGLAAGAGNQIKYNNIYGMLVAGGSTGATVQGNVISLNSIHAVNHFGASHNAIYQGNFVGVAADGITPEPNGDHGIRIDNSNNITIGGSGATANTIAYNNGHGLILITGNNMAVTFNHIFCNAAEGILLVGANGGVNQPVTNFALSNANTVTGTSPHNGATVHAYINSTGGSPGCGCEGETLIGTGVVAGGVWSITHGLGLSATAQLNVTVTVSVAGTNTSVFSTCTFTPLPVEYLAFNAQRYGSSEVLATWQTVSEINNAYFAVERSTDAALFQELGTVLPNPASGQYQFIDPNPEMGRNYYRLRQVDLDGQYSYSETREVYFTGAGFDVQPGAGNLAFTAYSETAVQVSYQVVDLTGRTLAHGEYTATPANPSFQVPTQAWAAGVYVVQLRTGSAAHSQKVYIQP